MFIFMWHCSFENSRGVWIEMVRERSTKNPCKYITFISCLQTVLVNTNMELN